MNLLTNLRFFCFDSALVGFEGISHGPLRDMIMASYDMIMASYDMTNLPWHDIMIIGTWEIIVTLFWPKAKYVIFEINLLLARYPGVDRDKICYISHLS